MDEKMRIVDLVNNPTPALAAEYFYSMYPNDYTWRPVRVLALSAIFPMALANVRLASSVGSARSTQKATPRVFLGHKRASTRVR